MTEARQRAMSQIQIWRDIDAIDPEVAATIEAALRAPELTDEQWELVAKWAQQNEALADRTGLVSNDADHFDLTGWTTFRNQCRAIATAIRTARGEL